MRIEHEHCQVTLTLDDPDRAYRDVDVVTGTVTFEAGDQPLSVQCLAGVGFGVELYGAENAREMAEYAAGIGGEPASFGSVVANIDGLASVNRVGAVVRAEPYDPDREYPVPLAVEAGGTGEIRFSERVGDDVPSFRGELLGCHPAIVAGFSLEVGTDKQGHPTDYAMGTCWEPIQLEVTTSGDSEEELGKRAAEIQELLLGHIRATSEWPLHRLLKWTCILLSPLLGVIPMLDSNFDPPLTAVQLVSVIILSLGLSGPSWVGAVMLLVLVGRWFRNRKPDRGRSLDPAVGHHAVYLLDGRDRLLYFVYWDPRRTKAEPDLRLRLEFRESCLLDHETGESLLEHRRPVTDLSLSLADAVPIADGLLMTGTVPFTDDLPAILLPERPGWQSHDQVIELGFFVGLHGRLETVDGQHLVDGEVILSTGRTSDY